jgi:hypothetical protein
MRRQNQYRHLVLNEVDDTCRIVGYSETEGGGLLAKNLYITH